MRDFPSVRRSARARALTRDMSRVLLTLGATLALVGGLLPAPATAATATPAPEAPSASPQPTPEATQPAPQPGAAETPAPVATAVPDPQTTYAPPPVTTVPLERDEDRAGAEALDEEDKGGDVTLDAADPGNVPYPASGASSGSVDGAASGRLELTSPVEAVVPAAAVVGFAAGNIISNSVFTNRGTMSEASIRSFIDGKVAKCQSGYTCLENYLETTPTRGADSYCSRYTGGTRETAARIIFKVAQACGINPQVLLVMLQKEQGLVTHTWPSTWRFTIAMGMGCPDTADCDKTYYGFFNQVYGAARQMKIYGSSSYFTWYAPGGTRSIRYHPNASCGSSGVYVQNQATANLYYYTPYQPNRAAIAAGMGTGDSCSSYGNRNFYSYFRTWFGSTGGGTGPSGGSGPANGILIKAEPHVYLVTGGKKVHITKATLSAYQKVFGAPKVVKASTAGALPNGGEASFFLRNAGNGDVSLFEAGRRHHFSSCAQVSAWGSACGKETVLAAAEYARIPSGAALTRFARTTAGGRIVLIQGSKLIPLYNAANAKAMNGGTTPYAAVMPYEGRRKHSMGRMRFAPGRFIEPAGSPHTYLATWDMKLLRLPTWLYQPELGLSRSRDDGVSRSVVGTHRTAGTLSQFVKCGRTIYLPAGGTLHPVAYSAVRGFPITTLDATTCGVLKKSTAKPLVRVFVQGVGKDAVYVASTSGVWRHVTTRAGLEKLGGGSWPTVHRLSAALVDYLPKGAPYRG